jgi:hypothetical protein
MKPYAVILYDAEQAVGRHLVTVDHRREFYCIAQPAQGTTTREPRSAPAHIWWADDEVSADALVELLATNNPGTTWVKVKSGLVFSGVIEKFSISKSKFTEKGLLPS